MARSAFACGTFMLRLGRTGLVAIALIAAACVASAQTPAPPLMQEPQTILLWPNGAPGAQGADDRDKPALTIYMPPNTTGPMTAVIIAPGGSYARLSMNNEGRAPANYLNALGIAAFVLRYRLGPQYPHPIELGDAQRAIRTVRALPPSGTSHQTASASWGSPRAATWLRPPRRISI